MKIVYSILVLLLTVLSLYYSLFWGWSSGAGVQNESAAESLMLYSNIALALSAFFLVVSISILVVFKKKEA